MTDAAVKRFLCYGAGAIGTYIGGSLALAGNAVVFLERPDAAARLREQGLRLRIAGEERAIPNPLVADTLDAALALGPFDAALFAIKAYDTSAALEQMAPFAARMPVFLSLQNGVENEARLESVLGAGRVIAATTTSAVERRGPGDIVLERFRGMALAGGHPLSQPLADALTRAGLNAELVENSAGLKWSKMLTNLVGNASAAILNMTPGEVYAHLGLFRLEIKMLRETLAVMRALRIPLVGLPRTPVKLLAFAARWLPPSLARPLMQRAVGKGRGDKMPSFLIDMRSGRGKSEVDYLNGAVARFGAQEGVPAPVNAGLTRILLALTEGARPAADFDHQPARLIEEIDA